MSGGLQWTGLDELEHALRNLPADLADSAGAIVLKHADRAQHLITEKYPIQWRSLRAGMQVQTVAAGRFGAAARVINRAFLAGIVEAGAEARHTLLGYGRGSIPPKHIFVPIVMRERRAMYEELKELLRSHGFTVTGDERA